MSTLKTKFILFILLGIVFTVSAQKNKAIYLDVTKPIE